MHKFYIRFEKKGYIIFTSHLDMMRLFQRSFKRAGIKLAYSQGFNPHPKMSFAQPLSLGYSSEDEYLEFETSEEMEAEAIKSKLNAIMPTGIQILTCAGYDDKKTLASKVCSAIYQIVLPETICGEDWKEKIAAYLMQPEILMKKTTKKGKENLINIKPMIKRFQWLKPGLLRAEISTGSNENLNPQALFANYLDWIGGEVDLSDLSLHREKLIFE